MSTSYIMARELRPGDVIYGGSWGTRKSTVIAVDCGTYMVKVTALEATKPIVFGPGDTVHIQKRRKR